MSSPAQHAYQKVYRQEHKAELTAKKNLYNQTPRGRFIELCKKARHRGIERTIKFEDYVELTKDGKCFYCGSTQMPTHGSGLDRRDYTIGYVKGNCFPCCYLCNSDKGLLEGTGFPLHRVLELLQELIALRKS